MPRVNLAEVKSAMGTGELLVAKIEEIFSRCSPDDPPYLSDLIVGYKDGGALLMEALGEKYENDRNAHVEQRYRWTLHAFRDEWGNTPQPGDIIIRKIARVQQTRPGKPVTARQINDDKRAGIYDQKWTIELPYEVDSKGCIKCEFQDAVYFLNTFGVHGKSGYPMARHGRSNSSEYDLEDTKKVHYHELSSKPKEAPDGNKYHVWYHRFKEVDKEDYAKLETPADNWARRGHVK